METIGKIRLHQSAWVVAKLQCVYKNGETWEHVDGSGGIPIRQSTTIDPGDHDVPTGSEISPYVFVVWGNDKHANEIYQYEKGNSRVADYTLTGTTLDSSLAFNGIINE
jgi:hypothetical protein